MSTLSKLFKADIERLERDVPDTFLKPKLKADNDEMVQILQLIDEGRFLEAYRMIFVDSRLILTAIC